MLHVAARENSTRCAEVILSHSRRADGETVDVEVDALATEHRQTPLMTAALHGHVDMLRLLVDAGADIDRQTSTCSTALIVACHYGHVDCVHALLGQSPTVSSFLFCPARQVRDSTVATRFFSEPSHRLSRICNSVPFVHQPIHSAFLTRFEHTEAELSRQRIISYRY